MNSLNFSTLSIQSTEFESLTHFAFGKLNSRETEALTIELTGEDTHFLRFNAARVRQSGTVRQTSLTLTVQLRDTLDSPLREATRTIDLTGISEVDRQRLGEAIQWLREQAGQLPLNPHASWPGSASRSSADHSGLHLPLEDAPRSILDPARGLDFTGIYAAGRMLRAVATSTGIFHWFTTDQTTLDYSVISARGRACKGTWAGRNWDSESYIHHLNQARTVLPTLEKDPIRVPRGEHRAFLTPAAVSDLLAMFSWRTISEEAIQQGDSALARMRGGQEKGFSPLFNLSEDFTGGNIAAFNSRGELAPETLPLFQHGKLVNTLVNTRSAREFRINSNQANLTETLRAPVMQAGSLPSTQAMDKLDTGLWLSNLHYLNWSDQPAGRITGMTRHACLWIENGRPVAPIENLRFDDTLFRMLGTELEALTVETEMHAETGTYRERQLGTCVNPGALLRRLKFTL